MKQFRFFFLAIVLCLFITSCATTGMPCPKWTDSYPTIDSKLDNVDYCQAAYSI